MGWVIVELLHVGAAPLDLAILGVLLAAAAVAGWLVYRMTAGDD